MANEQKTNLDISISPIEDPEPVPGTSSPTENPEPNPGTSRAEFEPVPSTSAGENEQFIGPDNEPYVGPQTDSKPDPCTDYDVKLEVKEGHVSQADRLRSLIELQVDIVLNLKESCESVDIQRAAHDLQDTFRRISVELVTFCEFAQVQYNDLYREVDQLNVNTQFPEEIIAVSSRLEAYRKQLEQINKALKEKFGANQLFWKTFQEIEDFLENARFWGTEGPTAYFVDPLEYLKPETDHQN